MIVSGHGHERQRANFSGKRLLVRHPGKRGPRIEGWTGQSHGLGFGRERPIGLHCDQRLGQRCVFLEPANRRFHPDFPSGL